jgi:glycosyltransferase involved in cell wall biosynthesis
MPAPIPTPPRPRILLVSLLDAVDRGGQRNILQLVPHLVARGFEVVVAAPGDRWLLPAARRLSARGLVLHAPAPPRHLWKRPRTWLRQWALARALREVAPRVVYVDAGHQAMAVRRAAGGLPLRILWHAQTAEPSPHDAEAVRAADTVVSVSPSVDLRLAGCVGPARRVRVPNGIDTVRFTPADPLERARLRARLGAGPDADGTTPLLLSVGSLEPAKGTDDLLAAFCEVARARPGARLLLAGGGKPREVARLRALARDLPGVAFLGPLPDVGWLYQAADLFLFPSHTEGLPLCVLEAMASGCPVVASDIPGNRVLLEGGAGSLVPVRAPAAMAQAALALLSDAGERGGLAGRALQRVRADYGQPLFLERMTVELARLMEG